MHVCHAYDFEYSEHECLTKYQVGLNNPSDETAAGGARCLSCERGKRLYIASVKPIAKGGTGMATNKPCRKNCGKKSSVKDGLCTACFREEYGRGPFEKPKPAEEGPAAARKRSSPGKPGRARQRKPRAPAPVPPGSLAVSVDFAADQDLHARLTQRAREEDRTLDKQVLNIVRRHFAVAAVMKPIRGVRK